jgi:hypothetical protein
MRLLTSYTALEPSYTSILGENARAATFSTSQAVDLFASTSFLYSLGIMIIVVAAAWRYGLAGIWRMQASERGQTKSNEELKRVTLGLLGVLSLFTILYTVNKGLLKGDIDLKSLRSQTTAGVQQATTPTIPLGSAPSANGTEEANRQALAAAGITRIVSTSGQTTPCTQAQMSQKAPTCTNLADMPQAVITMLIELKSVCPGNITITGGTEPGHNTHGPGRSAVDIDDNDSQLNACIRAFPSGPNVGSWCTATFSRFGFIFCDERGTSHWHVYK